MIATPIAFIIFNRPIHARESFATIRAQRPAKLFIIADGPRHNYAADKGLCSAAREVVQQIDWPCEVHHNYASKNLGLKRRVSSGLDWVFEQVDRAIVLEDDCVPHPDFFPFCDALLQHYESNERVSVITGNNFQDGRKRGDASYYFSKYNHCWGWATWRRAWQYYRGDLPFWPEWSHSFDWSNKMPDPVERRYWAAIFERVKRQEIDSWAYPWTASVWYRGGLTATPNVNLVTNIGFGPDGTHTISATNQEGLPAYPLGPLTHPDKIEPDLIADRYVFNQTFGGRHQRWLPRLTRQVRRMTRRIFGS